MKKDLFSLDGKVVIITGAGGLLGRQHADAVASYGGNPILIDIKQGTEKLSGELNAKYNVEASNYVVDITCEDEVRQNCKDVLKRYGRVDSLVNNAANNPMVDDQIGVNFSRFENFPIETWWSDLAVGLTGSFLCAKHYGKAISDNPKGGVIINISSDLGLISPDQRLYKQTKLSEEQQSVKPVTYSVIKTGLIGLTRYLATYWPNHVRCNALCPGGVDTGMPKEFIEKIIDLIPMGRMAKPNEYQGTLIFLLSEASKYMNGAVIPMDGGRSVW